MTTGTPLIWPTTPLQQGLVALAELGRSDPASVGAAAGGGDGGDDAAVGIARSGAPTDYVGQSVVQLAGPVDLDALRAAIAALVADQPHLHAGFLMNDDVAPVQFIEELDPVIEVHDPTDPDPEPVAAVLAWQRRLAWDLHEPPLLRWDVVLDADDRPAALVIAAHHIVLDGWSMPLLVAQVARHYARLVGAPSELPAVRGSYADHLAWLAEQDTDAARAFWATHLSDLDAPTPAWLGPTGGARRPTRLEAVINPLDPTRLAECGLTPAAVARTCWGLALDAVTGSCGTPFAVAVSTRDAGVTDVDDLIGLTTDAVLVAERPDPGGDVLAAAADAARRWTASLPHQHVGLRGIHAALRRPETATSLLAIESAHKAKTFAAGEVTFALTRVDDDTHYPLAATLVLGHRGDNAPWRLEVTYDAACVEEATARRHADAFTAFVEAARTATRLGAVDVLGAADAALLAGAESRTAHHAVGPVGAEGASRERIPPLLPEAFSNACARFPQRTALVDADPDGRRAHWTFAQLAVDVAALRDDLRKLLPARSEGPPIVAVTRPRSARTVVALLAILEAGAAALVMDPALPSTRSEAILAEVGAALVVTADGVQVRHDHIREQPHPHEQRRGVATRAPQPGDIASVVLTSGSTGMPKPVAVPHRALAHLLEHHSRELHPEGGTAPRQVAHAAAFHFDAHWDALLAMFAGHTVHVLSDDLFLDPFALAEYVEREGIDYLDLTPTVWSALLAADAFTRLPRVCVLGGEALPPQLWAQLRERCAESDTVALNLYGPTEATVDAAWASLADHPTPVVGRPLGTTGLLVLDDRLRRVPPGTSGELYLTGPQLADGYLGRAGLTAERFVANPYPRRDDVGAIRVGDERMYRTGDVARWTQEGLLVLGGRTDGQLSLAGRRVEPGEIEAVLTADGRVREAAVVVRDSVSGRGRVVGYVVPERLGGGQGCVRGQLLAELLTACRAALPAALVPADLVLLDAWPLTPNGKLDRSALPAPGAGASESGPSGGPLAAAESDRPASSAGDAPVDPCGPDRATADLRDCLADVLQMPAGAVGDDADFFALGGDSIAAIQICGRMRSRGWTVRAAQVLTARSVAAIAACAQPTTQDPDAGMAIEDPTPAHEEPPSAADDPFDLLTPQRRANLAAHLQARVPGARLERVLPLSPTQLGIYIDSHRLRPDPYRTTVTLRLDLPPGRTGGSATAEDIDAGVAAWFARHESLRIAVWQGDLPRPIAVVVDHLDVPHRHLDATHLDETGVAALLERVRRDELERDISFEAARLAGYTWVRTGPATAYLIVSMHHLLADGWSTPVLAAELRDHLVLAPAAAPQTDSDRAADRVFADYLRWWEGQDGAASEDLWRREFADAPTPTLLGRGTGADTSSRERTVAHIDLDDTAATALSGALRRHGLTVAAACQAAWARVLADLTGGDDVTYLLASAGRPEHLRDIESAVGMFVTTRPVRLTVTGSLVQVGRDVTAALARTETAAHLGLGRVNQLVGTVADSLVVVENYPRPSNADDPNEPRVTMVEGNDATTFPVTATVTLGARPALEVEIDPAQCDADAHTLARAWRNALGALVSGADAGRTAARDASGGSAAIRPRLVPVTLEDSAAGPGVCAPDGTAAIRGEGGRADQITTAAEVAGVMAEVLGAAELPQDASFFDVGGDSILAVRLVGALRGRGLRVGIADVFGAPTPRALAPRVLADPLKHGDRSRLRDGDGLRLTPALSWYQEVLQRGGSGRGFQQLREILLPAGTSVTAIGAAAQRLVERHDALRLRVGLDTADVVAAPQARLAVVPADALSAELRVLADEIDPGAGDLVRWAVVAEAERVRLVVLAHHVAVDAVSWGIITDDLHRLIAGADLPPAPSFAEWTRTQADDAVLAAAAASAPRWTRALAPAAPLFDAYADVDLGLVGAARDLEVRLDADTTQRLRSAGLRGWRMETLLLAALTAGRAADLVVELEGHGRPTEVAAADPRAQHPGAGAVGWFTATWPVRLPGVDAGADDGVDAGVGELTGEPGALCRHVARVAQAVESARVDGPDYGLLRHLHPEHRERLADAERGCPPQILLNYLGTSVAAGDRDPAALEGELGLHADLPVSHLVELNVHLAPATATDGPRLVAHWQVASVAADGSDALVQQWALALRAIAALDLGVPPTVVHDAVGLSPRQLETISPPLVRDDAGEASANGAAVAEDVVQAVWPATPVQRGMIFHAGVETDSAVSEAATAARAGTDPYTSVLDVGLAGALDPAVLRAAIEGVLAEHPQLRLRVRWIAAEDDGVGAGVTPGGAGRRSGTWLPVLVTVASTDCAWRFIDLTRGDALDEVDPADAVAGLVAAQLRRGYDLARDPLLRVTLVRTADDEHRLVLANHHLLLDGWSMPLLLDAVLDRYTALGTGAAATTEVTSDGSAALARSPFARHIARAELAARAGADAALERRRALLADSPAGPVTTAVPGDAIDQGSRVADYAGVRRAARRHGTTESAIIATAWGALLAALTGRDEAVTGTVVSGRDPETDTDLLGMFTDTIAVLARFGAGRTIAAAVADLAGQITAALVEPPVGLARLGSALGRGHLFDALLVVENYPGGDTDARAVAAGLRITRLDGGDATHYPLGLTVETASERSELRLEYDRATVPDDVATAALDALGRVLDRLADADPTESATALVDIAARTLPETHLGAPAGAAATAEDDDTDPSAWPVAQLVAIFRDLFGAAAPADAATTAVTSTGEAVDADANFFALGGDSILAMSLVTACREQGLRIRAGDVFTAPSPRALAQRVTTAAPTPVATPIGSHGAADAAANPTASEPGPAATRARVGDLISLDDRGATALEDLLRSL
ncbi:amino acid adenylation domain-containing protein [Kineosphaera limosa]|uniref:Putative non-ribosomal peptide synthetase n=1 Tax=Kineosphaera limosa NBRC 100340 TaxID=1184609 RepID=K6VFG8_9MICO|nr:condensation domain-containing protein [Kineosphaera limosa]NYE00872.1 amino acid adenylation domain-containing protein [Kineosphaera limosa]GAB94933.1 putative non-ribosomal peptide synthetase [Kineosphaera limosa NBRC 100340]